MFTIYNFPTGASSANYDDKFRDCLNDVARYFFGTPNRQMSQGKEMRYGTRGSLSIDLAKGVWRDHETGEGGGVLDLVMREMKFSTRAEAAQWLEDEGFIESDRPRSRANGKVNGAFTGSKKRIRGSRHPKLGDPIKTYSFVDLDGKPLYEDCRFEPKDFRPRQPDNNGAWYWDLEGLDDKRIPYRLQEITEAIASGQRVEIFEGGKAADAAVDLDLNATYFTGGAGGWRDIYREVFRGADVVVNADNDEPGRKFAETVATALVGTAARVRILKLGESWKECPVKGDFCDWQEAGHTREQYDALVDAAPDYKPSGNKQNERDAQEEEPETKSIPEFSDTWWCDVKAIPQRRWLYGQHYIRGHASTTIADGGMGKTTLAIIEAICIATDRALLGQSPKEQCKVWYWNGEEPRTEIARRVHAVCLRYGIDPYDLAKMFRFTSGLDEFPIKIVTATKQGVSVDQNLVAAITAYIRKNDIGVMIVDPFISCHGVPENDNVAIDTVAKSWARLAAETNCAIELPHHTRKSMRGDNGDATAADARGAGALINAVRGCRIFNPMSEKEAGEFKVDDRSEFFRVNRGKVNMVRRSDGGAWYQLKAVWIGNSTVINDPGDSVQTVISWDAPDAMQGVTTGHAHAVRARLAAGEYRRDYRSKEAWVGAVIAEVVGLDPEGDRTRIEKIIKAWVKRGMITEVPRYDPKVRHDRLFVEPSEDWSG